MTRQLFIAIAVLATFVPAASDAARRKESPPPVESAPSVAKGSVHGVVRDGVNGLGHIAIRMTNRHRSTHSGKGGEFTFKDVRPGVVTLFARTRHHGQGRVTFAVQAGQAFDVVLALRHPRPHYFRHRRVVTI